ncbi:cell cycle histidine kinase CckA [Gellertiella hungarica]|uniref:histidine kinase n=1 Tax=Gellertiella hungarica TaxID=1572859 RepID=A0A7W6NKT1_9HYPH|nr:PAS domain-containing sensor histidine kinase [Gellertiella hungarica]MBB4064612.1 two-component system cell cycle sensor histidine kinase/response regulator CckA [Gellertiella hungarica]
MDTVKPAKGDNKALVDRSTARGATWRILLLAIILLGSSVAFVLFRESLTNELVLGLLGVLAMAGIFFIVSAIIGFVEIMPPASRVTVDRGYLDSHPDGFLITDPKGHILYANAAYGALTGATRAKDVQSLEMLLSRTKESGEALYRLSNRLQSGKNGHEEFRLLKPLGQPMGSSGAHWYRLKARILPSPLKGQPANRVWQITDITAERDDQERFFKELQNAIDYLDHAPAGFFSAGRKGEIIYLNATLADWLGIDLTKFTPGALSIADLVAGEGLALIQSIEADPGVRKTATVDLDLRRTNGQSLPVRLVHSVTFARDGAPGESRTIVLSRGSDRRDDDASISAMRFNRFFNNTPMAIASVDGHGRILRTNAPFLRLFAGVVTRDDVENGVPVDMIVPPAERPLMENALAAAKDRQGDIAPIDLRHPKDETRHLRYYVNAVIDQSDEAPEESAIVYAVEVTEQKALETQMAQTQKMNAVGTLAGGIAHDFNNVLTAILLSSDHLLLQARPSDASFADLMEIKRNANRAAVLVRQLLAFSRKQTMRPSVLVLTDVVGDLRMLVDRLLSGTNVKLKVDYGRDLWPVKTDLSQFEQVLINLCVNARDAMPKGGELTIRTRNFTGGDVAALNVPDVPAEDHVVVEVTDTGTGIAPDIMDKIFEPFFTTKEVGKGTGLGLAMVYGIVKQSGGHIQAESEVGKGTTFRIFLPRFVPEVAPEPAPARTGSEQASGPSAPAAQAEPVDLTGKSAVVLLVEDEEAVRRGGKRMLETRGYTVHEAGSGIEALDIMDELDGKVDIVVSDVVMPEMDGPTLLTELRKKYPDLKFIFVSGYAEDAFARNLPADAKFGFLPKPFSLKQLAEAVYEMLDGKN